MLFYDVVPDYLGRRAAFRGEHLERARAIERSGVLRLGVAQEDPADVAVLVFRTEDRFVVDDFARADPHVVNGLVTSWRVRAWNVVVGADRARPERLCRCALRPPLATERLKELPDGRLQYELRHRWRDGVAVVTQRLEFLERLAA